MTGSIPDRDRCRLFRSYSTHTSPSFRKVARGRGHLSPLVEGRWRRAGLAPLPVPGNVADAKEGADARVAQLPPDVDLPSEGERGDPNKRSVGEGNL